MNPIENFSTRDHAWHTARKEQHLGYFTRHERAALGWGSQKKRISKDSIKLFHACTICLKLCETPLVCPEGDLFCKECIFESLLTQKRRNKQKLSDFNQQQLLQQQKQQSEERKHTVDRFLQFDSLQHTDAPSSTTTTATKPPDAKSVIQAQRPSDKKLSCFWIPSVECLYLLAPHGRPFISHSFSK